LFVNSNSQILLDHFSQNSKETLHLGHGGPDATFPLNFVKPRKNRLNFDGNADNVPLGLGLEE